MSPLFLDSKRPIIDINLSQITTLSKQLIGKLSISGVQKKLSLKWDKATNALLPAPVGGEYILKPQLEQWSFVPENENLTMDLADLVGINTALHTLISLGDGSNAYLVKRFDRIKSHKLAFEDFAQLLGIYAQDKYSASVESMGKVIDRFSAAPGIDKVKFFKLILFNFLVGNTDAHTKNYGLLGYPHGYRLSPAYDLVSTKLIIPEDKDESALQINGKKNHLKNIDFEVLAHNLNLSSKSVIKVFRDLQKLKDEGVVLVAASKLPEDYKTRYEAILSSNWAKIS